MSSCGHSAWMNSYTQFMNEPLRPFIQWANYRPRTEKNKKKKRRLLTIEIALQPNERIFFSRRKSIFYALQAHAAHASFISYKMCARIIHVFWIAKQFVTSCTKGRFTRFPYNYNKPIITIRSINAISRSHGTDRPRGFSYEAAKICYSNEQKKKNKNSTKSA